MSVVDDARPGEDFRASDGRPFMRTGDFQDTPWVSVGEGGDLDWLTDREAEAACLTKVEGEPLSEYRLRQTIETLEALASEGTFIVMRDGFRVWSVELIERAIERHKQADEAERIVREAWNETLKRGETYEEAAARGSVTLRLLRNGVRKAIDANEGGR